MATKADILLDEIKNLEGGQIIPLDSQRKQEWINAGLYSQEFANYFLANPNGETENHKWETRHVDQLVNFRFWVKEVIEFGFEVGDKVIYKGFNTEIIERFLGYYGNPCYRVVDGEGYTVTVSENNLERL